MEKRRQRRHRRGKRGRAAHALHQAHKVDPAGRGDERNREGRDAKHRQAQQPYPSRPHQIGQAARHHDHAAVGQDVAVQDPIQLHGRAAQVVADGRQHHGGAGEAQRNQQRGQAGRQQLQPTVAGGWKRGGKLRGRHDAHQGIQKGWPAYEPGHKRKIG
ncbi:hypothetical protein D3C87_1749360 [compost metagenome]